MSDRYLSRTMPSFILHARKRVCHHYVTTSDNSCVSAHQYKRVTFMLFMLHCNVILQKQKKEKKRKKKKKERKKKHAQFTKADSGTILQDSVINTEVRHRAKPSCIFTTQF